MNECNINAKKPALSMEKPIYVTVKPLKSDLVIS